MILVFEIGLYLVVAKRFSFCFYVWPHFLLFLYSNIFFVGGGFALSEAAKKEHSDLNGKIGDLLKTMSSLPNYFIILLIIIFTVFITNFASNVAVCNVIAPIVMQLVREIQT